jgi:fructose/tagatose bisphosphate aldolase
MARALEAPVAVHLDHGDTFQLCVSALRAGYTSIMIDGSKEILEKNIAITKLTVEAASDHLVHTLEMETMAYSTVTKSAQSANFVPKKDGASDEATTLEPSPPHEVT